MDRVKGLEDNAASKEHEVEDERSILMKVQDSDKDDKIQISIFGVLEMKFTVKKNISLSFPLRLYSQRIGHPVASFRFVFDGGRVKEKDTPESLGMATGDVIEVYKDQLGGNC